MVTKDKKSTKSNEKEKPLKKIVIKTGWSGKVVNEKVLYKGMELQTREPQKVPQLVDSATVATAAEDPGSLTLRNKTLPAVTVKRKIDLIHYTQSPYNTTDLENMEAAVRRNFAVRNAIRIRLGAAFQKQKLVVDLPQEKKDLLSEKEVSDAVKRLKDNEQIKKLIQKFATIDKNVGLAKKLKTLAVQCYVYGRGVLIVLFKDEGYTEIKNIITINSRRLAEPILNEEEDLKFEGVIIDSEGLSKDSMIYATYFDHELSPHTEHYGYSLVEPIMHIAETHNIATEEDIKEIIKSAWLATIGVKIDTDGITDAQKSARIQTIIDAINPGKIIGFPTDIEGDPIMLDLQPQFEGLNSTIDGQETKIYNNFQIPLFLAKSDEIANRATANKSVQFFLDGPASDDQQWMEDTLGEQWYDPLLREELKENKALMKDTVGEEKADEGVDTEAPEGDEAPLPFVIRRRFEKMTVEDLVDLADALTKLKDADIWDTEQSNKKLHTEEVTDRVLAQAEERQKKMQEMGFQQPAAKPGTDNNNTIAPPRKFSEQQTKPAQQK